MKLKPKPDKLKNHIGAYIIIYATSLHAVFDWDVDIPIHGIYPLVRENVSVIANRLCEHNIFHIFRLWIAMIWFRIESNARIKVTIRIVYSTIGISVWIMKHTFELAVDTEMESSAANSSLFFSLDSISRFAPGKEWPWLAKAVTKSKIQTFPLRNRKHKPNLCWYIQSIAKQNEDETIASDGHFLKPKLSNWMNDTYKIHSITFICNFCTPNW